MINRFSKALYWINSIETFWLCVLCNATALNSRRNSIWFNIQTSWLKVPYLHIPMCGTYGDSVIRCRSDKLAQDRKAVGLPSIILETDTKANISQGPRWSISIVHNFLHVVEQTTDHCVFLIIQRETNHYITNMHFRFFMNTKKF